VGAALLLPAATLGQRRTVYLSVDSAVRCPSQAALKAALLRALSPARVRLHPPSPKAASVVLSIGRDGALRLVLTDGAGGRDERSVPQADGDCAALTEVLALVAQSWLSERPWRSYEPTETKGDDEDFNPLPEQEPPLAAPASESVEPAVLETGPLEPVIASPPPSGAEQPLPEPIPAPASSPATLPPRPRLVAALGGGGVLSGGEVAATLSLEALWAVTRTLGLGARGRWTGPFVAENFGATARAHTLGLAVAGRWRMVEEPLSLELLPTLGVARVSMRAERERVEQLAFYDVELGLGLRSSWRVVRSVFVFGELGIQVCPHREELAIREVGSLLILAPWRAGAVLGIGLELF